MHLLGWLAGWRTNWSSKVFAARRVRRLAGSRIESLETRLVLASPTVSAIVPDPSQPGADIDTPRFVVTFSEAVTGVDPADFVAVPGSGVIVAPVALAVTGSGATYTVTVNGITGVGTLGLNLVDNNSIRDGGGRGLVGNGNGTFQAAQNFATGASPRSVAVGDMNGDGRLDLAVANYFSDTVSVLLGNGNGTFQAAQNFATGDGPHSVTVGDVTGDGHLDLAVANFASATVSVLRGNGNGTFEAAQNFATGFGPISVAVGDVDGDSRLDLAVTNYFGATVSVLLGNGNATFQAAQNFAVGDGPHSVTVGDVNADGRQDLAVANRNSDTVSVLLGNGEGTFQAAQNFDTGSFPLSVTMGDMNGDSRQDLAVANGGSNTVSVLLGNGNGTFQAAQNFATGTLPFSVSIGDVNGDGRLDLAVANFNSATASVLLGNGTGTFQAAQNFATGPNSVSVAVGDVNGDGRLDLAIANRGSDTVSVLLNAANGSFAGQTRAVAVTVPSVVSIVPDPSQPGVNVDNPRFVVTFSETVTGVDPADFVAVPGQGVIVAPVALAVTGSGTTWAVTVNGVSGVGALGLNLVDNNSIRDAGGNGLAGNGNGSFQAFQDFATGARPWSVSVGDLNGDGQLDLAAANLNSNSVSVLLGNGNGTFQAAQNFATGANPFFVSVGDLDGDGRLDLVVANVNSASVSVLLGNGNGTFQAAQNFATGARPVSVSVGDVNGDGRLDLAVTNRSSNTVSVLLGNGNGTFQAAQNFPTGAFPASVSMGDVNGDGRLDLAVANINSSTVSVLLGNGNGTFQAAQNSATGASPFFVSVGDLNGDGRLDLAVANYGSSTVSLLLGNGNGTFQAAQNFATGTNPTSVSVSDVNGDGRLDLAVVNYGSNTVSVRLGNGNGTFQAAQNFATGISPRSVAVGDVNGDGRLDLAVARASSDTVSVLLNAANGNFTGQTRAVDTIAPSVVSIIPDPSQPGTNIDNPRFVVTFSEAVTGVDAADFVAVPGLGVVVAPGPLGVTGSGTTYTVTVNGVSGVGTLGLNLVDDSSIRDGGGNRLAGNGDGTFQAAQNFSTGTQPFSVAAGDVNGDGRLDLAVANINSNTVSVLLGNGNGTFQAAQNFATGNGPISVAVGDVDGDGRLDLTVANAFENSVSVLLGNGNGTFQATQNFAAGAAPRTVEMGDVNGDGRLDLVVANIYSATVSVLLGNGNGEFQAAQAFATGAGPVTVAVGDVNGDGRLDLAAADLHGFSVSVLLGNGNGTFQAAQDFATGSQPRSVAVGDFNGDGRLDLAVANYGSATVSVLMGNGNGTFETAWDFATGLNPHSVTVGDVNGDGRLDLAIANLGGNSVSVLLGNGNGTFETARDFATGTSPHSVIVGDVNEDGRPDLAVANFGSHTVSVLLNAADGNFTGQTRAVDTIAPTVVSIVPDPTQPAANVANPRFVVTFSEAVTGVDPADFVVVSGVGVIVTPGPVGVTGSGTTYTVTVNGVSGTGTLGLNLVDDSSIRDGGGNRLAGNGDGTFQAAQNFATGASPRSVAVGDVNGDGWLDLAVANRSSHTVSVLLGNGNGTFQAAQDFATGTNPFSVAVGDVNGDGRLDLTVANLSGNTVSVLLGNGNGTFQAAQNFGTGSTPVSVSVGDVNGDGRLDLAVANYFSNTVSVLLGNGNGTFQAAQNFATGTNPFSVAVGDVNRDGRLDLAVANFNSNTVSVLLGNGNGTFQVAQDFATGDRPRSVVVGDMNGDGQLDLAVANRYSNSVSVLLGNGNGTFQAAQNFATGERPYSVSIGDVNGDGLLDLAVANNSNSTVSVLLGNGNGTFQSARNVATEANLWSVSLGDVNGDGRLDLAVANRGSDTVSVLLNAANGDFTGQARAVDTIAPTVTSVSRQDPLVAVTAADQLTFRVTFSEAVQNVSVGDFALGGTSAGDGSVSSVTPVGTSVYDVLITGVTDSNGTIQLLFAAGQDITDLATNALTNTTPTISETYTLLNNSAPTALALGNTSIEENVATGTTIGTFTTTDPDAGNTFTYTLVTGTGSTDNAAFQIVGNELRTNAALDFETKSSYSIRVRTTDQGGLTFEQTFTISVTNVNEQPTALALSNATVAENVATGTGIGTFSTTDPDAPNTFTYSLVTGTGSTDNGSFQIVGNELQTNAALDFETKSSYAIRVRTTDQGGLTFEQTFTITVTNVNEQPTSLALSNATVAENVASGTAIGTFSSTDPDAANTFTYSLVTGTGSTDNSSFQIVGNELQTNAALNFETKSSYAIRVRTTDEGGLTFEQTFTISVTNANEAPTALALSNATVAENVATGTAIGTLSTTDPDAANTFTYSLVTGTGSTDNSSFEIVGNELRTNAAINFGTQSSYAIRVRTTDEGGLTFEQTFTITVTIASSDQRRFDFGTSTSPVQTPAWSLATPDGYLPISSGSLYSGSVAGAGWLTTGAWDQNTDLVSTSPYLGLIRDSNGDTSTRQFAFDLPAGTYQLTAIVGAVAVDGQNISVVSGGTGVDMSQVTNFTTTNGQFRSLNFTVNKTGSAPLILQFNNVSPSKQWAVNALEVRPTADVTAVTVTPPGGTLAADGTTVDVFTVNGSGIAAGTRLFTIATMLGTISQINGSAIVDADPSIAGVQFDPAADSFTIQVTRPSGPGTSTVTVDEVTGAARGAFSPTYVAPAGARRFDFGTTTSPVQAGYSQITPSTTYTANSGWGWLIATQATDRGALAGAQLPNLIRDSAYAWNAGRFRVNLAPNSTYELTVTLGDTDPRDGVNVTYSTDGGTVFSSGVTGVNTNAGERTHRTFTVTTGATGSLILEFADGGGSFSLWSLAALEIRAAVTPFTMSSIGSVGADGSTVDSFNVTGATVGAVYTISASNGVITTADADPYYSGVQVVAPAANFGVQVRRPGSTGSNNVSISEVTGASRSSTGTATYTLAASRSFDFNVASVPVSPTAPGHLGVLISTQYTAALGYGWVSTVGLDQRDYPSVADPALRDLHWHRTGAQFRVDVAGTGAAGSTITLRFRDPTARVFQVQVLDTANTPLSFSPNGGGNVTTHTYSVAANTTQTLTLTLATGYSAGNLKVNFIGRFSISAIQFSTPQLAAVDYVGDNADGITAADLDATVAVAKARWLTLPLTAEQRAVIDAATFQLSDFGANRHLGLAVDARTLKIDDDAAGYGWFVDASPLDDSEFGLATGGALVATTGPAAGRFDLLTVVMHELGNALNLSGAGLPASAAVLALPTLDLGTRRLPGGAASVVAGESTSTTANGSSSGTAIVLDDRTPFGTVKNTTAPSTAVVKAAQPPVALPRKTTTSDNAETDAFFAAFRKKVDLLLF